VSGLGVMEMGAMSYRERFVLVPANADGRPGTRSARPTTSASADKPSGGGQDARGTNSRDGLTGACWRACGGGCGWRAAMMNDARYLGRPAAKKISNRALASDSRSHSHTRRTFGATLGQTGNKGARWPEKPGRVQKEGRGGTVKRGEAAKSQCQCP
jgi:hypothetical protein